MDAKRLTDAQSALAAANVKLAYFVADRFRRSRRVPAGLAIDRGELVGEALLGLSKAAASWREGVSAFSTYAVRVIENQLMNACKARARYRRYEQFLELEGGDRSERLIAGREPEPSDEASDREFTARLRGAIAALSRAQREAAELVHVAGWKAAEAARLLGVSRKAVTMRLLAARGALRDAFGE